MNASLASNLREDNKSPFALSDPHQVSGYIPFWTPPLECQETPEVNNAYYLYTSCEHFSAIFNYLESDEFKALAECNLDCKNLRLYTYYFYRFYCQGSSASGIDRYGDLIITAWVHLVNTLVTHQSRPAGRSLVFVAEILVQCLVASHMGKFCLVFFVNGHFPSPNRRQTFSTCSSTCIYISYHLTSPRYLKDLADLTLRPFFVAEFSTPLLSPISPSTATRILSWQFMQIYIALYVI